MNATKPRFSIAIPTFNRAALLMTCVRSALAQSYPDFEVVVCDNASDDATQRLLSACSDPKLRVIRHPVNIGLIPNWNACLAAARGDYVVILSDDDIIAPWMLERCAALIDAAPGIPVVVTLSNLHAMSIGRTRPARASRKLATGIWPGSDILEEFLADQITVTMCSVLLRTNTARDRGFSAELPSTADVAVWAPMLLLGKAGLVNEACATFAYHSGSETSRLKLEQRLKDGTQTAALISHLAERDVIDVGSRKTLQRAARLFFARRGLLALSDYCAGDVNFGKALQVLRKFRSDIQGAGPKSLLRFTAKVLCPPAFADRLRRLRTIVPGEGIKLAR